MLQGGCPGEQLRGEEALGMHSQQYASRATNLREFPFRVLHCSGDLGGNFVFELCVLEQHMDVLGGVCVWNKEAAKKKSRGKI